MPKKRRADDTLEQEDKKARKQRKKRASLPCSGGWKISKGVGGNILNIAPIFSGDGETLLVAYSSCVRAYSTSTSLLLGTFEIESGHVTGLAASSSSKTSVIFISTDAGTIEKWDWATSSRINVYDSQTRILSIAYANDHGDEDCDAVVSVNTESETSAEGKDDNSSTHRVSVHFLSRSTSNLNSRTIRKILSAQNLHAFNKGKLIAVSSGRQLHIGRLRGDLSMTGIKELSYNWYELSVPDEITSLDFKLHRKSKSSTDADVAVGTITGPIYNYTNLISTLKRIEKGKKNTRPSEQKLHWHRFPVKALKFSNDGNYIISGGLETVLCNWVLDTGKREDLPHLTAGIESITISSNGASYAVKLGNNSLIILSTLDFKPTFALSGPIWPSSSLEASENGFYPSVVKPQSTPGQLLLAGPSSNKRFEESDRPSAVYLQTIDLRTGVQLERQALTRSNVTDKITDPSGRLIKEPDVTRIAVSMDGMWLASVDSWSPPESDEYLKNPSRTSQLEETQREVYLKFWKRSEEQKLWELSSRIDNPHGEYLIKAGTVIDLVATPGGFATIGSDGRIKIWRQRYRKRNNIQVLDHGGKALTNWNCVSSISISSELLSDNTSIKPFSATLSSSEDGSLLSAIVLHQSSTIICLVDIVESRVVLTRNDLQVKSIHGSCILGKYLVFLSENLLVWDIVTDEMHFSYALRSARLPTNRLAGFCHLASNSYGQFAVAVPTESGRSTQIAVFDVSSPAPISLNVISQPVKGLHGSPSSRGFVFIDEQAQIHQLAPSEFLNIAASVDEDTEPETPPQTNDLAFQVTLDDGEGSDLEDAVEGKASLSGTEITQARLAEIFDTVGSSGPGTLKTMFDRVAALAIGREQNVS